MPTYRYRAKGTNNETWSEGSLDAPSEPDAISQLDAMYGVKRDDSGQPTNTDVIQVEIVKE